MPSSNRAGNGSELSGFQCMQHGQCNSDHQLQMTRNALYQETATLGAVRKTVLSSSKSTLSMDAWVAPCCTISPAGMSIEAVDANAVPAGFLSLVSWKWLERSLRLA